MALRVQDFVGKPRDTKAENDLCRELRALESEEAFHFIWEYLDHDGMVGLCLANRVLRDRLQFERILDRGFDAADVSGIRFWLEACMDRVGPKRVLASLRHLIETEPLKAYRVFYWTRILLLEASPELKPELDELGRRIAL